MPKFSTMAVNFSLVLAVTMLLSVLGQTCSKKPQKPKHLLLLMADDMGWNDIGYNNPEVHTPNLDELARTGIKFTQSYVQPLCSPSRSALMTGTYPFAMGLQHLVILPNQPVCLPFDRLLLPEMLQQNGFETHLVGKWHLGYCKWECTPTYRGFDSFFGLYLGGGDYYTKTKGPGFDFRNNTVVLKEAAGTYSTIQFTERAKEIIEFHDPEIPLFLFMTHQNVHSPMVVPDEYLEMYPDKGSSNRRALMAMSTMLDDSVGAVVQALKDAGMYEDTLILFTSDNGGETVYGGNNIPLRGGKASLFDGGSRVPAFIHGAMLENQGSTYDGLLHVVDWFPTLASAFGLNYMAYDQDGVDQWKSITQLKESKRNEIVYSLDLHHLPIQGRAAIRVGDYKLIEGYPGLYEGWYQPYDEDQGPHMDAKKVGALRTIADLPNYDASNPYKYLFNLKDDPEEKTNLYDSMPEKVKELQAKLDCHMARYMEPNFPYGEPMSDPKNYGGIWSPGWC